MEISIKVNEVKNKDKVKAFATVVFGDSFKITFSHAVNDDYKNYPGENDAEKKGNILKKLCKEYDKVVFVDDDRKNINAARGLKIDNLKVIKAWDE